jgi:hypothetical protein
MTIYVTVAMEEGINRAIAAFTTKESAKQRETAWLESNGINSEAERERASDWGRSFSIWEVQLKP